jgi:hypothetical protein
MSEKVVCGNASFENEQHRGWFVGEFMPDVDLRHDKQVEIKWGQHDAGKTRNEWTLDEHRKTMCVLIAGKFRLQFEDDSERVLSERGDYAVWGPAVSHTWEALENGTTIMTVRWLPEQTSR